MISYQILSSQYYMNFLPFFFLLVIWDLIWKGVAIWKAARNGQKYWFVALMVVNSIGILPILYIKFFRKKK